MFLENNNDNTLCTLINNGSSLPISVDETLRKAAIFPEPNPYEMISVLTTDDRGGHRLRRQLWKRCQGTRCLDLRPPMKNLGSMPYHHHLGDVSHPSLMFVQFFLSSLIYLDWVLRSIFFTICCWFWCWSLHDDWISSVNWIFNPWVMHKNVQIWVGYVFYSHSTTLKLELDSTTKWFDAVCTWWMLYITWILSIKSTILFPSLM